MEESTKGKEARAVQYTVTQEMVDTLYKLSGIGADISLLICSFRFLGNFVLDNSFIDESSRGDASGWYQSHVGAIEKLEKFAYDVEVIPRGLGYEFEKAIEAIHGESKEKNSVWNLKTTEMIDRLGMLTMEIRELTERVEWRIDEERKAEKEAA